MRDDHLLGPEEVFDPVEDERVLDERFLGSEGMVPMGVAGPVPAERFERFRGVFPNVILRAWERFGFDGFNQGLFWLTDPIAWQPVVDAWLDGLQDQFPFWDRWWCLGRTALGKMELWGEESGNSLSIHADFGMLFPTDKRADMRIPIRRERSARTMFSPLVSDIGDPYDENYEEYEAMMYGAIQRLGVLTADQVYAFDPPASLSGDYAPETMRIEPAIPYLSFLAKIRRKVMPDLIGGNQAFLDSLLPPEYRDDPEPPETPKGGAGDERP
ncbi:MAG: GAD-like domain-containing protein [Pseudoclavibacter sp.]|nr:GAD-like domain-containing protein [Pseudoclavibacter sp.]